MPVLPAPAPARDLDSLERRAAPRFAQRIVCDAAIQRQAKIGPANPPRIPPYGVGLPREQVDAELGKHIIGFRSPQRPASYKPTGRQPHHS